MISLLIVFIYIEFTAKYEINSDTCLKQSLKRRPKLLSRQIIAKCRSTVLQNAPRILSTFIKLPFVIMTFVLSILSGRLRQVYGIHVVYRYMMQRLIVPESLLVVSILIASDCLLSLSNRFTLQKQNQMNIPSFEISS